MRARSRSRRTALGAGLAVLAGLLVSTVTAPANAGPVDAGWSVNVTTEGTGFETVEVSDGSDSAAQMTYNADGRGGLLMGELTFSTVATEASADGSPVRVPWSWEGLHAWYQVTAQADIFISRPGEGEIWRQTVAGDPAVTPPRDCCTTPSNGFVFGGVAVFPDLQPGDTYGFQLAGRNGDFNDFIRGTLTLSNKPYIDATIGTDNRQWTGATEITAGTLPASDPAVLEEPGEARWYKFRVAPGQRASVDLTNLPKDYDVALYGDIQESFDQLSGASSLTSLAAASVAGAPANQTQVPEYDDRVTTIPTADNPPPVTTQFAPRVYAPRVYAPRVYAPRVYAPRVYAPRVYAPRVYAPNSFVPELPSDQAFRDAFSAAQNQSLLVVSANTDLRDETVTASTGNTLGYFYVRVQGHGDQDFDPVAKFSMSVGIDGGAACQDIEVPDDADTIVGGGDPTTIIVTDTNKLGLGGASSERERLMGALEALADRTDGVVVDVSASPKVVGLQGEVQDHPTCPYATNLVAQAVDEIVDSYRGDATKYVVLAGGDEVIPFFRYADIAGLGEEKEFVPPVLDETPSGGSLANNQVLSQDAYGSSVDVTINGLTVPIPDLAVGRLVKTPAEIVASVEHFLDLDGGTLPAPDSSLVTGYDFLADAAEAVHGEFVTALPQGRNDTLIEQPGTPYDESWTGADLARKLMGDDFPVAEEPPAEEPPADVEPADREHALVYLAGHFSANDTLAADFETTFAAQQIAPYDLVDGDQPTAALGRLTDSLVLSAGCHSGYNIVNTAAVPDETDTYDWTQAMAQQNAVLIGGTGYQYGDTDFLEYSERLYLNVAKRLREGPADGSDADPVAIGQALTLAKQDYLATLSSFEGIDQKALLQATLYGLPMTGFDAPGRAPLPYPGTQTGPAARTSAPVFDPAGMTPVEQGPGATLGLSTFDFDVATQTDDYTKTSNDPEGAPVELTWREGRDGVAIQPGAPALPKQVEDVTPADDDVILRGVGFRGGVYADRGPLLPSTGAPAIEGSTPKTTFDAPVFWPQSMVTPNYFGALTGSGRTSLILTPTQYRNAQGTDPEAPRNIERSYDNLDLRLFYADNSNEQYGDNRPSLAAAPGISDVAAVSNGSRVRFSARVAGDPSAGVQEVWVTWTGAGSDSGYGSWQSIDLVQDETDSTLWTANEPLPPGQSYEGMRFLVQAANGVGAVSLDTADGDGYPVDFGEVAAPDGNLSLKAGDAPTASSPLGVVARVTDGSGPTAPGLPGRTVRFTVTGYGSEVSTVANYTDADGNAPAQYNGPVPPGRLTVKAELFDEAGQRIVATQTVVVESRGYVLSTQDAWLATRAGTAYAERPSVDVAYLDGPAVGYPVTFTLPAASVGATFPDGATSVVVWTDENGRATAPPMTANPAVGAFQLLISGDRGNSLSVPMASQYGFTPFADPVVNNGVTTRNSNANTPLGVGALLANGARLSDSVAASLVQAKRVQVRWRVQGDVVWSTKDGLVTYDAAADQFRANLKGPSLGLVKGTTYEVQLRVLPAATDPKPLGTLLQSDFDLGHRGFLLRLQ